MRDQLALARHTIRMLVVGGGSASDGGSVCRDIPLRNAGRELDVVVLLAVGVPLRNPARRKMWRGKRGAFLARRAWP